MRRSSMLIAALGALTLATVWVPLRPTVVLGHSMTPTMRAGGCYLLNTHYYHHHPLQCGDIVVFRYEGEIMTKRIYALPGQQLLLLRYDDGVGNQVIEPWEAPAFQRMVRAHLMAERHLVEMRVPPGECFVLGDNRLVSCDSRTFGCIPINTILGRISL